MKKIKEKILNNYENEIKKEIELMKKKGFIITTTKKILQYDPLTDRFKKIAINDFYLLLNSSIKNYWHFKKDILEEITEKYIFNSPEKNVLPVVDENILNHYYNYIEAKNYLAIESNKISKRTINKLLKENDSKKDVSVILNIDDIKTQAQILINNNVFIDTNRRLYKYNENINSFELITHSDINELLYNNLPEEIANSKLIKQTIINAVNNSLQFGEYIQYLTYAGNTPSLAIQLEAKEKILNSNKEHFKIIEKIIKNYE